MTEKRYAVTGMTCEHCVRTVSSEIGSVTGVRSVGVDLASGQVTVHGDGFTDVDIRLAVDEAGYQLADS